MTPLHHIRQWGKQQHPNIRRPASGASRSPPNVQEIQRRCCIVSVCGGGGGGAPGAASAAAAAAAAAAALLPGSMAVQSISPT